MVEVEKNENISKAKKLPKRGIIYLSTIPPHMTVTRIREVFGEYGKVGRVYLQLAVSGGKNGDKKSKRKVAKKFTEGWVEFERKSVAKKVVELMNNKQVDTRKRSKQYDCIWNLKYLSNFKWVHLNERLAYEKAAKRQKLRAEIQLAKKKTNYFMVNLDKKKKKSKEPVEPITEKPEQNVEGNSDDEPMETAAEDRTEFLQSLFS